MSRAPSYWGNPNLRPPPLSSSSRSYLIPPLQSVLVHMHCDTQWGRCPTECAACWRETKYTVGTSMTLANISYLNLYPETRTLLNVPHLANKLIRQFLFLLFSLDKMDEKIFKSSWSSKNSRNYYRRRSLVASCKLQIERLTNWLTDRRRDWPMGIPYRGCLVLIMPKVMIS